MSSLKCLLAAILFFVGQSWAASVERPNLVFILADDLSWSDLGCYGNEIFETPYLDRLATEGMRFTNAYSPAPICSASRAAILTGKTPARLGFEFVTKDKAGHQPVSAPLRAPPFTLNLSLDEITLAESLGAAGYQTAFFGKWHVNQHYQRYLGWSPTHGPNAQGFEIGEEDFGSHPYAYWRNQAQRSFLELPDGEFPEDTMTQRAIDFLKTDHPSPFFLMVSHFYVHDPIHTRAKWLHDHYRDKISRDHPRRDILAHYGAMVTTLDHQVGRLLNALDESGFAESTLVVFTSDNGGHPNYAGNAPLRGSKWNLHEGGIRVPFLARWPGKIEAATESHTPVIAIDLFPTFAELGNADLPDNLDGRSLVTDFTDPDTATATATTERDLIWHFPYYHPEKGYANAPADIGIDDGVTSQTRPHSAIRSGPWKLLHFYEDDRDELYHLPTDHAEQTDRATSDPEIANQLRQKLDTFLELSNARLPEPHPDWPEKP